MGQCGQVLKGDDKIIMIADDQGSCDLPILPTTGTDLFWRLPLTTATPIAPGATSLTVGTIPAALSKLLIRKGFWIGVRNTGASFDIPVQVNADFVHTTAAAGTTLTVVSTIEEIRPGATFTYPVLVGQCSAANPSRQRQSVQGNASDPDGYIPGAPGTASATMALTMDTNDADPGQLNVDRFQDLGETCVLLLYNPVQRSTIRRKSTMGLGYFTDFTGTLQNNATPTLSATFNFDRKAQVKQGLAA